MVVEFSSLEKIVGMLEDVLFSWREVWCIYYPYTQIPQSFTPPSVEIPSVLSSFTLHEGVLSIHIAVSFSIMVSGCQFPLTTANHQLKAELECKF